MNRQPGFHCSFCGKGQHEVRHFIVGPTVNICGECVLLCVDIMAEIDQEDAFLTEYYSWRED